jgi:hypothetical protein
MSPIAAERHGTEGRVGEQWMPQWMLTPGIALACTPTSSQMWRPDGENVAAAGFEPVTKGLRVLLRRADGIEALLIPAGRGGVG